MKFLPLVWALLWRSRARTWLTFLSIAFAFLLFALLRTLESGFFQNVRIAGDNRLIVTYRQGVTSILPYAHRSQIQQVPGVVSVQAVFPFGGYWQDRKNLVPGVALDIDESLFRDPRHVISDEHLTAWRRTRTGALLGRALADQYGWKIGDHIPLTIATHRKDGTETWEFDIVGFWDYDRDVVGDGVEANALAIRFDYWNESVKYPNYVLWYNVTIVDPSQATAIGQTIDALFLNSKFATKTQLEREFHASFLRQIGDIGAVMAAVLAAVFFTLVLVAGNAMTQAFRERVPEIGVLKTLGFGNGRLAALLAAEATLLCGTGALAGLALARLAQEVLPSVGFQGWRMPMLEDDTIVAALVIALILALVATVVPAWRTLRLTVVQALAERA